MSSSLVIQSVSEHNAVQADLTESTILKEYVE